MAIIDDHLQFDIIADLFLRYGILAHPSFYDGQLTAKLIVGEITLASWLMEIADILQAEQWQNPQDAALLTQWFEQSSATLASEELAYRPLLADELFTLLEQMQAVQAWAQGFLEIIDNYFSENQSNFWQEIKSDLLQLTDFHLPQNLTSDSEADLLVLVEHLRLITWQVYSQIHLSQMATNRPSATKKFVN